MNARNNGKSRIFIGSTVILPGESVELSAEEMKMSGIKAMLANGELTVVKTKPPVVKKKIEKKGKQ